jgi:hypothetical protein
LTFLMTLSFKDCVNVASKSIKEKNFEKKKSFLVAILKVTDENSGIRLSEVHTDSRIRIRICTKMSQIRNTGK